MAIRAFQLRSVRETTILMLAEGSPENARAFSPGLLRVRPLQRHLFRLSISGGSVASSLFTFLLDLCPFDRVHPKGSARG